MTVTGSLVFLVVLTLEIGSESGKPTTSTLTSFIQNSDVYSSKTTASSQVKEDCGSLNNVTMQSNITSNLNCSGQEPESEYAGIILEGYDEASNENLIYRPPGSNEINMENSTRSLCLNCIQGNVSTSSF